MPRLKNPNHEKIARIYAEEALHNDGKVVKARVYQRVYNKASYDSARSEATRMLARPEIQTRIQEIIATRNAPEDIAEDLAQLRKATRDHVTPEGKILELKDNTTRLGAVQTALKVMGAFQQEPVQDNRQVNVFNVGTTSDQAQSFLGSLSSVCEKLADLSDRLAVKPDNP